tara:strand:+ start:351 stop:461 length:111 start_codon:yes stop_codon:yes gene_type:complete
LHITDAGVGAGGAGVGAGGHVDLRALACDFTTLRTI